MLSNAATVQSNMNDNQKPSVSDVSKITANETVTDTVKKSKRNGRSRKGSKTDNIIGKQQLSATNSQDAVPTTTNHVSEAASSTKKLKLKPSSAKSNNVQPHTAAGPITIKKRDSPAVATESTKDSRPIKENATSNVVPEPATKKASKSVNKTSKSKDRQAGANARPGEKLEKPLQSCAKVDKKQQSSGAKPDGNTKALPTPELLTSEFICALKKRSTRFENAVYFCRLCDYHINDLVHADSHIKSKAHRKARNERVLQQSLKALPYPCSAVHLSALSTLLNEVVTEYGRSAEEVRECHKLANFLTEYVQQWMHKDFSIRLYGSSRTGLGLKSGNVNLELLCPSDMNHSLMLIKVEHQLKNDDKRFSNVQADYGAKWPNISFNVNGYFDDRPVDCVLSVQNSQAYEISLLLELYATHFPPLCSLTQLCRYWARLCRLDSQDFGGLPAYAFDLMAIYYLQQRRPPVLPIIHEIPVTVAERETGMVYQTDPVMVKAAFEEILEHNDEWNLAEMWLGLLKFYTMDHDNQALVINIRSKDQVLRDEKDWNKKRFGIEDPFLSQKNVGQMAPHVFEYFTTCLQSTFKYFCIPQTAGGPLFEYDVAKKLILRDVWDHVEKRRRAVANNEDVPDVTQALERVLNISACPTEPIVKYDRTRLLDLNGEYELSTPPPKAIFRSKTNAGRRRQTESSKRELEATDIDLQQVPTEEMVQSSACPVAVLSNEPSSTTADDDSLIATNVCETPVFSNECDFQKSRAVDGFGKQRMSNMRMISECSDDSSDEQLYFAADPNSENADDLAESDWIERPLNIEDGDEYPHQELRDKTEAQEDDMEIPETSSIDDTLLNVEASKLTPEQLSHIEKLTINDYTFLFIESVFHGGRPLKMVCSYCLVGDHHCRVCPNKQLPPLSPLPVLSKRYTRSLEYLLQHVAGAYAVTMETMRWRDQFRLYVEERVRRYVRNARLILFGSSCNGFGFESSDLDLCLTLGDEPTLPPEVNAVNMINTIARGLRRERDFRYVTAVTRAKVPIVRFYHANSNLEGDISLYNCLALRNTQLLLTYSLIDPRVKALGYLVKVFAKYCDIGDASRGTLSSYAYVIMMLHYLQHTEPPVIPVLQELCDSRGRRSYFVDGWDTYFYCDLQQLPYIWDDYGKNKQSLHNLWLGFFRYYCEEFNLSHSVIQIRRTEPLSKFEKLWCERPLAIEDPFDLKHNLASGLSWRMYMYIMKTFIRARDVFGNSSHERIFTTLYNGTSLHALEEYYFGKALESEEPMPRDGVCKLCGHVGHFVEQCPWRKAKRKKSANEATNEDESDIDDGKNGKFTMVVAKNAPANHEQFQKRNKDKERYLRKVAVAQRNEMEGKSRQSSGSTQNHMVANHPAPQHLDHPTMNTRQQQQQQQLYVVFPPDANTHQGIRIRPEMLFASAPPVHQQHQPQQPQIAPMRLVGTTPPGGPFMVPINLSNGVCMPMVPMPYSTRPDSSISAEHVIRPQPRQQ